MKLEDSTEIYTKMDGQSRRYIHSHKKAGMTTICHPATITKLEAGALRLQELGHDQVVEADKEQEDFSIHLRNYGGEWF